MDKPSTHHLIGASIYFLAEEHENAEKIQEILEGNNIDTILAAWPAAQDHLANRCDLVIWSSAALQNPRFVEFATSLDRHDVMFQVCFDECSPPNPMRRLNCLQIPEGGFNLEYEDQLCHAVKTILGAGSHSSEPLFTMSTRVVRKMVAMNLAPTRPKAGLPPKAKRPFRMGSWLINPGSNHLSNGEEDERISAKAMDVLVLLALSPGEVCSMDDILSEIWGKTIVSEDSVHRCISELRRSLNDSARNPSYIETIPKRGYRIIATVQWET